MAIKTKPNSEAVPPSGPAHFVPLSVIRSDYRGKLARYMAGNNTADVVVTMPLEIDVAKSGKQKFFVAVAVTTHFDETESLADDCLLYTSPSPRDRTRSRMPSSA